MPTSAAISRKLKPSKPPCCMRRSAASMIAAFTSLMNSLPYNYLLIDSPSLLKTQRVSAYLSIESSTGVVGTRSADGETETLPLLRHELWQSEATAMFSVIFEVQPRREKFDLDLELAKGLKPILEGIVGFIDNERFESTRRPGWILSHSTWRDEKSVVRLADGGQASRHAAARPGRGVPGLSLARGRDRRGLGAASWRVD